MNEDNFTPNQVVAIVEDLRGEFRAVAEVVLPLREDMVEVKNRLEKVEFRLSCVEDAVRVSVPSLDRRVSALEAKAG